MRATARFAAFLALAVPAALQAQVERPSALVGAEFRSVSFGDGVGGVKSITEFAVPLGVTVPLSRRVSFDLGSYYVSATGKDVSDNSSDISGLTDVIARGVFQIKPDVAVLTVAFNLPTGTATLDTTQVTVVGATATDLIPFPVQNFGSGFNVTTGLALAAPVGAWALGFAGSVRYNGEYEPFVGVDTSLQPGTEFRLRFGADRLIGQGRFSLGVTYSNFTTDDFGSRPSVKGGSRIIPQLTWNVPLGTSNTVQFYAWDIYRNVTEDTVSNLAKENTIALGAVMSLKTGRNTFRPLIEYRQAWKGPGGMQSNGTLFGVGARYAIAAGSRLSVVPSVRFDFGSLPDAGVNKSYSGISGGLLLRTSF